MKIASLQILLCLSLLGCAVPEKKVIDITGMTKDQVILETKRVQLEENKVAARREENKAWWTGVARQAGTVLINVGGSWLRARFGSDQGLSKDR